MKAPSSSPPSSETTVRGFSAVSLLPIGEAARVPSEIYFAVRPMLAASNGHLWLLATSGGKQGFFPGALDALAALADGGVRHAHRDEVAGEPAPFMSASTSMRRAPVPKMAAESVRNLSGGLSAALPFARLEAASASLC